MAVTQVSGSERSAILGLRHRLVDEHREFVALGRQLDSLRVALGSKRAHLARAIAHREAMDREYGAGLPLDRGDRGELLLRRGQAFADASLRQLELEILNQQVNNLAASMNALEESISRLNREIATREASLRVEDHQALAAGARLRG